MNNAESYKTIHRILESQTGFFLKCLTVKELCILQRTSSCFRKWSKIEIDRRYQNWLETCSRAWPFAHWLSSDELPMDKVIPQLEYIAKEM